jgi:hypothetical protein
MNKSEKIERLIKVIHQAKKSFNQKEITFDDVEIICQNAIKELKSLDLDEDIETFIHSLF